MKQKKLHRKGSDCGVLEPVASPLSVADDDPAGSDVINMAAVCFSGHVTAAEPESAMRLAAFEQKQQLYARDDEDNINVDSTDTDSEADL